MQKSTRLRFSNGLEAATELLRDEIPQKYPCINGGHLTSSSLAPIGDADLVTTLPGFKTAYAEVNGIRLHHVEGGAGEPLILLPSWPQTWWQFSRVLPRLAERYREPAVDFRGLGGSGKPDGG